MATSMIKSTFTLDAKTIRSLERLARRWKTSKSDVVRRLIQAAITQDAEVTTNSVAELNRLQERLRLTEPAADRWIADIRAERAHFPRTRRRRS
jgi:hypothetical protein